MNETEGLIALVEKLRDSAWPKLIDYVVLRAWVKLIAIPSIYAIFCGLGIWVWTKLENWIDDSDFEVMIKGLIGIVLAFGLLIVFVEGNSAIVNLIAPEGAAIRMLFGK